ncbi:phosphatidylglycerophosphatase A family protein [Rhodobacter calidifons]|uniref:Phosphatidylglycerophosphatase A n=1 Tax=Rhodobacter calidifons TaxID=2715277 RepID=A0ABX0G9R8_9RHOB|nr:phosphatidylglycerophosphatase A [Rhodobacter calidifons]NHB77446.1 phosphatidylglycerophosphatase A [Rhodobacter calidifons]
MSALVATFCGAGHLRPASGTWASAITVALAVATYQAGWALAVPAGFVLATLLGFWAVPRYLAARGGKDPSEVVIDEVAGQLLALSFTVIPLWRHGVADLFLGAWPGWVAPFLLFRLFDIWKPWLVGRADRRGDAAGVMLDDLWAGLFAGVVSVALAGLWHGVVQPWLG